MLVRTRGARRRRIAACTAAVMATLLAAASRPAIPAGAQATPAPSPEPGVCTGCQPPLTYHNGPVMTTPMTITAIYWAPSGYTYPDGYQTVVNQYISDVAAASGRSDNVYGITPEYYQTAGSTQQNLAYSITAGTPITDTNAYPPTADPCTIVAPYTACVTRAQLQAELVSVLTANSLPADLSHFYVLFFPPNVQTAEGNAKSGDVYCGIHGAFDLNPGPGTVVYADEPLLINGCGAGQSPNNNLAADTQIGTLSHEIIETMTDPQTPAGPAWYDSTGNEIGDECSYNYGAPIGAADPNNPQTTAYNQVINGHFYYEQTIFSNASYAAQGKGRGCILTAYGSATPAAYVPTDTTKPATATLDAGKTELPADGSSSTTVTVTILDGNGEPVSGDHVHIDVKARVETPGVCGTVDKMDGATDDNGQFVVNYTASKADVACFVMAIDLESGASDSATIYQGSSSDIEPAITDATVPSSLTPGGPAQTFSVTASNPSHSDIGDARFDLFLTGDNNGGGGVGLQSSQVHVSYSDSTTGGSFVTLPLTGETVKDGEIDGYVTPDTAASLPAGGSRSITFQISLDSSAPTTSQTGTPLHIETDIDQFNPADQSQFNLDYVGPADVTVGASGSSGGFPLVALIAIIVVGAAVLIGGGVALTRRRTSPPAS